MAQLRVVLDQLGADGAADLSEASTALVAGLIETAPRGCTVEAIVPAGVEGVPEGVASVRRLPLARRELTAAWQMGLAPRVGGGMIHAVTLLAPLVRHDRLNDHDQTVPTLWDLRPWDAPETLPRAVVLSQRALLRRAVRHADAVVVPTHAVAARLAEIAALGDRIRVIAGAPSPQVAVPSDAAARRSAAGLPDDYVVLAGAGEDLLPGLRAAAALRRAVVVLDAADGDEAGIIDLAESAGLPAARVHVRERSSPADRAAVLDGAGAFVCLDPHASWPWRLLEAMALRVPIVALDTGAHRDVIADGGLLVPAEEIADALAEAVDAGGERLRVIAGDRARAFSWSGAAAQVWALHAEL
ncbi:glycosyltransferase family 4 protein [Microbacterium resistens]|uniref:glycosyltransferase n=1 Tax=Microbacterium resistens TaxID=156977 RepID=UPI001C588A92|nr:glycosyltransferase [Microbacterium resistens]MBW1639939.1 glycosyltransferase family 4 protein [Microbacterium resistens]